MATRKVSAEFKRTRLSRSGAVVPRASATSSSHARPRVQALRASNEPTQPFVVGIGASAGGLEALEAFFEHVPTDTGMCFVVVTHQHPSKPSLLPALLARRTAMPVVSALDRAVVEPNHVYVNPPGTNLAMLSRACQLMSVAPGPELHLPIDYFFRSLARDQEERAICIVLSGTGSDGTLGVRAIKAHAGLVMVQDEKSAQFSGMPHSAAATLLADYVLPPDRMPAQLVAYARTARRRAPQVSAVDAELEEALPKIFVLLRNRLGHDFSGYKLNTMRRRIERRMRVHQVEQSSEYLRLLQDEPHEIDLLFQELLITVTQFFRDPSGFDVLASQLASHISKREDRTHSDRLRVWVPGCSTGEEPYSIAMLATELLEGSGKSLQLQVFATDLDPNAIQAARTGFYPAGIAADVGAERLQRFFSPEAGGYRIRKLLRDRVIFATHNVLRDPPFTKLDLLSCRNLLIYLNSELQQRLFPVFHYALEPGGILWLGASETLAGQTDLFAATNREWKLYERREVLPGSMPTINLPESSRRMHDAGLLSPPVVAPTNAGIAQTMENVLLEHFVPPTLVVSARGDIAYIHGRTGAYLEPTAGEPRHNAFAMAREGLRPSLQSAIRRAAAGDDEVTYRGVSVRNNAGVEKVDIAAQRIAEPESLRGLIRVSFSTSSAPPRSKNGSGPQRDRRSGPPPPLQAELEIVRDSLKGTLAELQISNEELKSANEELQSTNEELQSLNEELETSKEELQSLNEELHTVNAELQRNVYQLSQVNDDMQNMLNASNIATLFLDRELKIKRYTEQARRIVRLIATDVGRPIGDLVPLVRYETLRDDAERVLHSLIPHEVEVRTLEGHWLLVRMLPYCTAGNMIDGVVITFVDIDRVKRAELLAASRACAESIVQTVRAPLLVLDKDLQIVASNRAFSQLIGLEQQQLRGQFLANVEAERLSFARLRPLLQAVVTQGQAIEAFELARVGSERLHLSARRLEDVAVGDAGLVLVTIEVVSTHLSASAS